MTDTPCARPDAGLFCRPCKKGGKAGQAEPMNGFILFCVGAAASVVSEIFWNGGSRAQVALWGGAGMLLLRRIALRFPLGDRVLLCLVGAALLLVLGLVFFLTEALSKPTGRHGGVIETADLPSFPYILYRFFLIAPAYAVIEYLEGI